MKFLPGNVDRKTIWVYLFSLPAGILIYFILFLIGYIFKFPMEQFVYIGLISFLDGIFIWIILKKMNLIPKLVVIVLALIIGFIISFVYITVAHEHAMWKICYPAIEKKLGKIGSENDPIGHDGYVKSWYQHSECDNNLLPFPWGRQAKFSDNPPGFVPKESSPSGSSE